MCDDFGVLLYRTGSPDILRRSRSVNLVPGAVWNEKEAGTNGVGLALELGGLAHVYAAEHYVGAFHGFSCTAAPVHHPVTREVLGVLGLAADTSVTGSFAPALVARAALDVERLLEEQVFGRERELLEHYLRGRAGRQAPFLTVDRPGHTILQNARMLPTASGEDVQLLLSIAVRRSTLALTPPSSSSSPAVARTLRCTWCTPDRRFWGRWSRSSARAGRESAPARRSRTGLHS